MKFLKTFLKCFSIAVVGFVLGITLASPNFLPRNEKIISIAENDFVVPAGFVAGANSLGALQFLLNATTLQQKNTHDETNQIEVNVYPDSEEIGSFFLRESGVDLAKCKFAKEGAYKICEYQDNDRGQIQIFYKDNKLVLLSNCTLYAKQTLLNKRCQTWGPFLDNLKITYSYPEKFHKDILKIDAAVKYILLNFYESAREKANGIHTDSK